MLRRSVPGPERPVDTGSASLLLLAVVALIVAVLVGLGRLAGSVLDAASAQSAADAAALAGATEGAAAAARVAQANGGVLVAFATSGEDVIVTVDVGGRRASARATAAFEADP